MIPQEETEERRARVLVVDDHEMNLRLLEDLLVPLGHRVARAHDGEEALAKVAQEAPDLILLDVAMPRLNGYQVWKYGWACIIAGTLGQLVALWVK